MLLFLFFFGLALGAVSPCNDPEAPPQDGNCNPSWYSFNSRCYVYVATGMTWADAEIHCRSQGANLVSIHSQAEQNYVRNLIRNFDPSEAWTWIGFSDIHKEGSWMWSDGSGSNFDYWYNGEPNNAGKEDCAVTNFSGKWNDILCSSIYPFVCESRN